MIDEPALTINAVVGLTQCHGPLANIHRFLGLDPKLGRAWFIALRTTTPRRPGRTQDYLKSPFWIPISALHKLLSDGDLYPLNLESSPGDMLDDASRLDSVPEGPRREALRKNLARRDRRFSLVLETLRIEPNSTALRSAIECLRAPRLFKQRLRDAAKQHGVSRTTALHLLHLFWAGGSQRHALMPTYHRCGRPGDTKISTRKLGRPPRTTTAATESAQGYVLTELDKKRLAQGYALVRPTVRLRDAFLTISSKYWAVHSVDSSGSIHPTLLPPHQRPTFTQFRYWGHKGVRKLVEELITPASHWAQKTKAHGTSEQDRVAMVGQEGMFDGTSSDVYLASVIKRLDKLPPMTRSVLKETQLGMIVGLYLGWDKPSPRTALKTILNAISDKVSFCARFGVEIKKEDWPSFMMRSILCDNGELKASEAMEAELQFGFALSYTPPHRGERKGGVESAHHANHKELDHRLPGTTHGRPRQRGEDHAALSALWNYYEYMEALLRYVIKHNTQIEVPDLAPLTMRIERPDLRPTRINIYHWLRSKGMVAEIHPDIKSFRAHTLPDWPATICKNGVRILGEVLGYEIRLPRLRYSSEALVATGLMSRVKKSGKTIGARVKLDTEDLSLAWLVTSKGLIEMNLQVRDTLFLSHMTIADVFHMAELDTRGRDRTRHDEEQRDLDELHARDKVTQQAKAELKAEEKALGGRPSKASIKANLRSNVERESFIVGMLESARASESRPGVDAIAHVDPSPNDVEAEAPPAQAPSGGLRPAAPARPPKDHDQFHDLFDALNAEEQP